MESSARPDAICLFAPGNRANHPLLRLQVLIKSPLLENIRVVLNLETQARMPVYDNRISSQAIMHHRPA